MYLFCYKLYFYGIACEQLIRFVVILNYQRNVHQTTATKNVQEAQYHQKDILRTTNKIPCIILCIYGQMCDGCHCDVFFVFFFCFPFFSLSANSIVFKENCEIVMAKEE